MRNLRSEVRVLLDTPIPDMLSQSLNILKPHIPQDKQQKLQRLGIYTVEDLLLYPPRKYVNFSTIYPLSQLRELPQKTPITLKGRVTQIRTSKIPGKKLTITEITLQDDSGTLSIPFFNQPFLAKSIHKNHYYAITGFAQPQKKPYISNPSLELITEKPLLHSQRLLPVYKETTGISSRFLRYRIDQALQTLDDIPDYLPQTIRDQYHLLPLSETIRNLHYPHTTTDIKQAKYRLLFQQALIFHLYLLQQKTQFQTHQAPFIPRHIDSLKHAITKLPFSLTSAQKRCLWEIIQDMESPSPMNRLLQGDVGTGKTIVASLAILNTRKALKQSALMAPTEILARQHFQTINTTFHTLKEPVSIALITNSEHRQSLPNGQWVTIPRQELYQKVTQGEIDLVIGTQSLITDTLTYHDLALVIVDEQHRFGVNQRAKLQKAIQKHRGDHYMSHLLSMTATPIPRSLALSVYGDLDISLLNEYPSGRKPVKTRVVHPQDRPKAYQFIYSHIQAGFQAFVVCPQIEHSPERNTASVESVYRHLQQDIFPSLRIAILHGQMKSNSKEQIMKDFQEQKYDIVVSTAVIEVGVDVPQATIMVIEGAERFGLAQLHQFRGRVGRGGQQSFCFLFETERDNDETMNERLQIIEHAQSGFDLAEKDLRLRGPGEFIGSHQSGLSGLNIEMFTNPDLVTQARSCAQDLLNQDLSLTQFPELKQKLAKYRDTVHFE